MEKNHLSRTLDLQWPRKSEKRIWPIFLPFLGCPAHCVFCAQEAQTGARRVEGLSSLEALLRDAQNGLQELARRRLPPQQLAFYGGTFTAIPENAFDLCLDRAKQWRRDGLIHGFRCSTRPDCLSVKIIDRLRAAGCQLVELGVQSFAGKALQASRRGYAASQIFEAMSLLRRANLGPGVQLLPGMPGSAPADFLADVHQTIANGATCLRFYPCVVLEGTGLEAEWRSGRFSPWPLDKTLDAIAQGWLMAADAGIPVIRMGLAPQEGLRILAGPWHEALGSRAMGRALALFVARRNNLKGATLYLPLAAQGIFRGWRQELNDFWGRQRLRKIEFWQRDYVRLTWF